MTLALLLACKLPEPEPGIQAEWIVVCESWECRGATGYEWGEAWAKCWWDCADYGGRQGQGVEVELDVVDGCWQVTATAIYDGQCSAW